MTARWFSRRAPDSTADAARVSLALSVIDAELIIQSGLEPDDRNYVLIDVLLAVRAELAAAPCPIRGLT